MHERDLGDPEVQAAVRQVADDYLDDANINSVGVGYKETDGERTEELVLQFTVGQKFAPEALEAAPTRAIPKPSRPTGSRSRPTSIERDFAPHLARRVRADAARPDGAGREHRPRRRLGRDARVLRAGERHRASCACCPTGTCSTAAAASATDRPAGPRSTTRARAENLCGRLVRSFLGFEGDCAIASIVRPGCSTRPSSASARRSAASPSGARRPGRQVGAHDGVTHGVVTRVQTITS